MCAPLGGVLASSGGVMVANRGNVWCRRVARSDGAKTRLEGFPAAIPGLSRSSGSGTCLSALCCSSDRPPQQYSPSNTCLIHVCQKKTLHRLFLPSAGPSGPDGPSFLPARFAHEQSRRRFPFRTGRVPRRGVAC